MLQKKKENIYFVLFLVNFSLTVTFIHITFRSLKISYSLLPSLVGFKTSAVGLTATSLIMRVPFFSIRFFVFCCIKFYSDEQLWIKKKKRSCFYFLNLLMMFVTQFRKLFCHYLTGYGHCLILSCLASGILFRHN